MIQNNHTPETTMHQKRAIAPNLLLLMLSICVVCVVILAVVGGGEVLNKILFVQEFFTTPFMDFFGPASWHLYYENPFENVGSVYPALGMLVYWVLARVLMVAKTTGQTELMISSYGGVVHVLYLCITCLLMKCSIDCSLPTMSKSKRFLLCVCLLCSFPFLGYAIKQGNLVFFTVVLVMLSLAWKDSENKYLLSVVDKYG